MCSASAVFCGQCVAIVRSCGWRYSSDHHWSVSQRVHCHGCLLWSTSRLYWQTQVNVWINYVSSCYLTVHLLLQISDQRLLIWMHCYYCNRYINIDQQTTLCSEKKTPTYVFDYKAGVSWSIFILFIPVEREMNTLQYTYLQSWWRHNCVTLHATKFYFIELLLNIKYIEFL